MGFLEWLTGRNGIYEDEAAIKQAKDDLARISKNDLDDLKAEVSAAVSELNNVRGFAEEVGQLNNNAFDSVIEYGQEGINAIVAQIDAKVQDIEDYNNSSLPQKIFATSGMVLAKVGEGFVGAFEDVGDAVLTAGAWVCNIPKLWTGEDTEASKVLQSAVKYDVSHSIFDALVYSKDWAKNSAITEDSGAASICRGVGQAAGYLTMGGYLSGANTAIAQATNGVGKLGKAATVLSSTTNANTLVAAIGGFGSGTEAGLQQGMGLEGASLQGAKEAVVQGAMTYAAGKFGEHQAVKNGTMTAAEAKAAGGFNDGLTYAAQQHGYNSVANVVEAMGNYGTAKGILIGTGQNLVADGKAVVSGVKSAGSSVLGVATHPVASAKTVLSTAKNVVTHPVTSVKTAATTVVSATKSGAALAAANAGTTALVAANALKDPIGDVIPSPLGLSENRVAANYAAKADNVLNPNSPTPSADDSDVFKKIITNDGQTPSGDDDNNNGGNNGGNNSNNGGNNGGNNSNNGGGNNGGNNSNNGGGNNGGSSSNNGGGNNGGSSSNNGGNSSNNGNNSNNSNNNNNNNGNNGNNNNSNNGNNGNNNNNNGNNGNNNNNNNGNNGNNNNNNGNNGNNNNNNNGNNGNNNNNNNGNNGNNNNNNNGNNNSNTKPGQSTGDNPTNNRPSTNNNQTVASNGNSGSTQHTGGGYSQSGYSSNTGGVTSTTGTSANELEGAEDLDLIDETLEDGKSSIDEIISGSKYNKIPSSTTPVKAQKSSSSSSVIPIAAGLSAAAAAGIGAKAYMDHKKNNETGEDDDNEYEDDDFATDDWFADSDEDTLDLSDDSSDNLLSDDDAYTYQDSEEKYEARSSQELADLQ